MIYGSIDMLTVSIIMHIFKKKHNNVLEKSFKSIVCFFIFLNSSVVFAATLFCSNKAIVAEALVSVKTTSKRVVAVPWSLQTKIDFITAVVGKTGDVPVTPGDAVGTV